MTLTEYWELMLAQLQEVQAANLAAIKGCKPLEACFSLAEQMMRDGTKLESLYSISLALEGPKVEKKAKTLREKIGGLLTHKDVPSALICHLIERHIAHLRRFNEVKSTSVFIQAALSRKSQEVARDIEDYQALYLQWKAKGVTEQAMGEPSATEHLCLDGTCEHAKQRKILFARIEAGRAKLRALRAAIEDDCLLVDHSISGTASVALKAKNEA